MKTIGRRNQTHLHLTLCLAFALVLLAGGFSAYASPFSQIPGHSHGVQPRPHFVLLTRELDAFMQDYGRGVSVYFENLESGFVYTYNESRLYYSASVIKAPYALWLYETLPDLDRSYVYTEERFREGAGVLRRLPFGSVINEADMLDYTVRVSDNAAFRMLLAAYGADGFKDWVAEKGGRTQHLHNITWAHMTVNDAAFFTRLMHEYIQTDGERNAAFEQSLLESIFPYIHTAHPLAHKHGNWDDALHDMGIVYAPSPYILVIFTDMGCSEIWPGAAERAVFREISQKMEEANERVVSVWLNRVR